MNCEMLNKRLNHYKNRIEDILEKYYTSYLYSLGETKDNQTIFEELKVFFLGSKNNNFKDYTDKELITLFYHKVGVKGYLICYSDMNVLLTCIRKVEILMDKKKTLPQK